MTTEAGQPLLRFFERIGADPDDTDEIRLQKRLQPADPNLETINRSCQQGFFAP